MQNRGDRNWRPSRPNDNRSTGKTPRDRGSGGRDDDDDDQDDGDQQYGAAGYGVEDYGDYDYGDDEVETVPCPNCRAQVFEDAEQCPSCGEYIVPNSGSRAVMSNKSAWYIILAVLGVLAVVATLGRI